MRRRNGDVIGQGPHPSVCDPQQQESSPRSERFQSQIGLLRLVVLYWGDEPLECPALKISGAYVGARDYGTKSLFQKGVCKISHSISISTEAVVLDKPGSGPLAHLEKPPEEGGGNWDSLQGWRCWLQPFWGLVPLCGHWCWKVPFRNPLFSLLELQAYPLTSSGLTPAPLPSM